ncbi:MAG: peptidoglycan bridge formation glycyltransferase FemA/FemB family protein [Patescibacteria group bacterium]
MENAKDFEVIQDLRQSDEYGRYMERIGWKTISFQDSGNSFQLFVRTLGPVSIAKIQRVNMPLPDLSEILKKNRVMMCKVEPLSGQSTGFRQDNWPLLASKTLRVDLRPSEEKIMQLFSKDCRYTLRKFSSKSLQFSIKLNQFDSFYEIWKKSSKRKSLWIPSKKDYDALIQCFGEKVFSVCIDNNAGALVLMHDKCAYYYYAGATKEGNKNNLPYLVVWEAMKKAREMGCKSWDFEGIYDNRWPNKGWLGFTRFKKGFGGKEIEFAGSFVKWRLPI